MSHAEEVPSRVLGGDHRDLDRWFEEFQATPSQPPGRRRELFERFATDLRRHMEVEESLLFPVFREGDPSHQVVVERMLEEHRRIEGTLGRIQQRLNESSPATDDLDLELVNVLWAHNAREEQQVYPWFDRHLSVELAERMRRELRHAGDP